MDDLRCQITPSQVTWAPGPAEKSRSDVWETGRPRYITGLLLVWAQKKKNPTCSAEVLSSAINCAVLFRVSGQLIDLPAASCYCTILRLLVIIPPAQEMKRWARPAWSGPVHADLSEIILTLSFIWASLWEWGERRSRVWYPGGKEGSTYWEQNKCFDGTFLETRHGL